jgi:hypothetical protein
VFAESPQFARSPRLGYRTHPGAVVPLSASTRKAIIESKPVAPTPTTSPNALQLRGCDFDGCGAVVADFSMLGAFDGPVAGAVAFDDAGVGAVAAFPVGVGEDFLDDAAVRVIGLVRGERPRSRRLRGGSRVGIG